MAAWRGMPRAWPLYGRLTACVAVAALVALALFVMVAALALQQMERNLAVERLRLVATGIATALESRVDLGLPLDAMSDAQRYLERELGATPGISRIDVFGPRGVTLFSTGRALIGEPVDSTWMAAPDTPAAAPWVKMRVDDFEIGQPIMNSFSRPVGGVVVTGATTGVAAGVARLLPTVAIPGLLLLAVGLGAGLWAARLFMGDWEKSLAATARRMTAAPAMRSAAAGQSGWTAGEAAGQRLHGILDDMTVAEREVRRVDEDF